MKSKGSKSKSYSKGHTSGNEVNIPARPPGMSPAATNTGKAIRVSTPQEKPLRKAKGG